MHNAKCKMGIEFCVILNGVKNLRSIEGAKILRLHFVSLRMTREVEVGSLDKR